MNLVKTLAKVAIGAMVARGVGKMMGGGAAGGTSGSGGGLGDMLSGSGLGGLLGGGAAQGGGQGGGLADMLSNSGLGGLLGGGAGQGAAQGGGAMGGLGGLLGSLTGGGGAAAGGGLAGMLGSVLSGGQGGQSGGLGGLLDSLQGAPQEGLGGMLNQALGGQSAPAPNSQQNSQAELMLRAMINAAKSDGQIDAQEKQKIIEHLDDVTQEEADFVNAEIAAPLDVEGFIGSVPQGMEQQVYLMSLLGIKLDSQAEAQYLDRIAKGMNIKPADVNALHAKLGVPNLYA